MEVPAWLLQEIGRLYVHGLALERALEEAQPEPPAHDHVESGFYQETPDTGC